MLGYLSPVPQSSQFSEKCSFLRTDNVRGQISEHISAQNEGYCLYAEFLGDAYIQVTFFNTF